MTVQDVLAIELLGNPLWDYLLVFLIFAVGVFIIRAVLRRFILQTLGGWLSRISGIPLDTPIRLVERYLIPLLYLGLVYVCLSSLNLATVLRQTLDILATIIATYFGINLLSASVEYGLQLYLTRKKGDTTTEQSFLLISPLIRVVFLLIGVLFLLDNLGFDIAALVASLGIGGIAIALAAQGVLQDLFSYFSILMDRPFEIGDFVILGDFMGSVEYIGIKTTRLRSLSGEQIVIANTDMTGSRIRNYKRMQRRRVVFGFGVTYETPPDKLQEIPKLVKQIIEADSNAQFDRAHFAAYGDFSLNFEVVYFVLSPDFNLYMDVQERINLALKQAFQERGIQFAYPTRVLYLNSQQQAALSNAT
ncbi:mechanosensitive ion channel family protein [Thermostichus vulcanus]|uniref:Mechanosensitive ion channel family protein n=1 Tax=Thermostichus vulcanus str. 'Rupite' TaxID=2813851 RepID=A0ABT0CBN3_THEVL|nr:mechanosensitive ion channel family protein [Thermostichus vulcanus]MCJ2543199.1 mechanosensitive ion channel family protein [Thermostichus vulcanus str. 'Rupite']